MTVVYIDSLFLLNLDVYKRQLMDAAARDKPAALVLCGDLTNGGTLEEHEALSARLGACLLYTSRCV